MKFPENWLREFVDPPVDRATLCQRLTMAGLEVENVEALGAGLDGVVVAEIIACEPHPNADKLRVCQVAIGPGASVQIVCGAPNARVGLKAPVARIGAILPNGVEIKKALLRGVDSIGMLCSAKELGLDTDASGLMELADAAPVGTSIAAYLALPDASIELKLTPNRPDCLGLRGLAGDVAALFGMVFVPPAIAPVAAQIATERAVQLDAGANCPRYCARVIKDIDAMARTPVWMVERLRRSGIRPISAMVDITQYVMLELGQPMHAYDNALIDGAIRVRHAQPGEKVKLLDGGEYDLNSEFLVIADANQLHGLAGIMGGFDSRVTDTTRQVFLEAAHFAPAAIMGRARKLGLHTDASHRFERGVDVELPRIAIERATGLLLEIAGGKPGPVIEAVQREHLPQRASVPLRRARLARVLGMRIADVEIERILRALGMRIETTTDGWNATPPSRRFDIEIEEDLIEEVARVHGYEHVPTHAPSGELKLALRPEAEVSASRLRTQLAAGGYREAINYSFVARDLLERWSQAAGAVVLANPLSADMAVMRTSLLPGLVRALSRNLNRQQTRVRLFELGLVFAQGDDAPAQVPRLAAAACGRASPESWAGDKRSVDFYDLKADAESLLALGGERTQVEFHSPGPVYLHPGRSAEIRVAGNAVGIIGSLHPRLLKALDLDEDVVVFELDLASTIAGKVPLAQELSKFPSVRRDIAVVVPERVAYAQIEATVRAAVGAELTELLVFDQYAGPNLGFGVKSLAIGLILQNSYRTLTDVDADRCVTAAVSALSSECQAKLRG
jgi:phenylalanyl-tRNA synthetase beta chain